MNINYKILNPSIGLYEYSSNNIDIALDKAKLQSIEFFTRNIGCSLIKKVYVTENNEEIISPYENNFY